MTGLRWVLWGTHLWVLFLGWLMLGSAAVSIDGESCGNFWQYDKSGNRVIYGNQVEFVLAALKEAKAMVTNANKTFERVQETVTRGDKDWESLKIKVLLTDLQGQSDKRKYFVETYRWKRVLGNIKELHNYLKHRDRNDPVIYCGDYYTMRYKVYRKRQRTAYVPTEDQQLAEHYEKNGYSYYGFQYKDTFLTQKNEDPWYELNQRSCSNTVGSTVAVVSEKYIKVCGNAIRDLSPVIGKDHLKDWAAPDNKGEHQTLSSWREPLSYALLRYFTVLKLSFEDEMLPRPIEYKDGSELTRATGYRGARALLEQKPDLVPTNIESLTLIILGAWMKNTFYLNGRASDIYETSRA